MSTTISKKFTLLFIVFVVFANSIIAQSAITGKVTDAEGNPITDVTVQVKGKTSASVTNERGFYSIVASAGDILVFTAVGYDNREVSVTGKGAAEVIMQLQNRALDE